LHYVHIISIDPTGTLKENEIYIFDGSEDRNPLISSSLINLAEVFVTRFPLLKTESISIFTVIDDNDSLNRYIFDYIYHNHNHFYNNYYLLDFFMIIK